MRASRIIEWLTLRHALRQASGASADERGEFARRFQLARQRGKAADVLWFQGHRSEALRMAADAFEIAHRARGAQRPEASPQVVAAQRALAGRTDFVGACPQEEDRLFEVLVAGRRELIASAGGLLMSPSALRRLRALRLGMVGLVAVVVLGMSGTWLFGSSRRQVAAASDYFGRNWQYQPAYAFDGDPRTEWWLPNGRKGWIEVRVDPPIEVRSVRVMGGAERTFGDHRVELWRGTDKRAESRGSEPRMHRISAAGVDRIRLVIDSWPGPGAAVAEINWDWAGFADSGRAADRRDRQTQ